MIKRAVTLIVLVPLVLWVGLTFDRHRVARIEHRRSEQTASISERLTDEAERLLQEARALPVGPERDALLHKARQAETAAHMDEWLSSPGLQPR
jgi:hypothetical protein